MLSQNTTSLSCPFPPSSIMKSTSKFYPNEPTVKRAAVFVDGQNLLYSLREAFGVNYPNYDAKKLAERFCQEQGMVLSSVRFYTGIENEHINPFWYHFWRNKITKMEKDGITTFTRPLQYRRVKDRTDPSKEFLAPMEKGVDIRIALDIVEELRTEQSDVITVFSQDSDFCEIAQEVRQVARKQNRWIKFVCAFPRGTNKYSRGINGSDWYPFDENFYSHCTDPNDYRKQ